MSDSVWRLVFEGIERARTAFGPSPRTLDVDMMVVLTRSDQVGSQCHLPGKNRWQVGLVKDANQVRHLALKCDCQAKDGQKVRELDSQLHRTHVCLRDTDPFGKRLLAESPFQAHFTNARAEQLADGSCVS